jgi:ribonuclease Z
MIICSHFSTRYHAQEVRRVVEMKLPAGLRARIKLWL